jgi:hypothetical protein
MSYEKKYLKYKKKYLALSEQTGGRLEDTRYIFNYGRDRSKTRVFNFNEEVYKKQDKTKIGIVINPKTINPETIKLDEISKLQKSNSNSIYIKKSDNSLELINVDLILSNAELVRQTAADETAKITEENAQVKADKQAKQAEETAEKEERKKQSREAAENVDVKINKLEQIKKIIDKNKKRVKDEAKTETASIVVENKDNRMKEEEDIKIQKLQELNNLSNLALLSSTMMLR